MTQTAFQYAGATQALSKEGSWADWVGGGLTAASLLPIPGVANIAGVGAGLWNTGRAAIDGDLSGVALGLAETGVGALAGGYGGKAVRLGAKALGAASKVKGLGTASKVIGGGAKLLGKSQTAQRAAKWIGKSRLATHVGMPLAYSGAKWALGGQGSSPSGAVGGEAGGMPGGPGMSAAQNVAPGVNFLPPIQSPAQNSNNNSSNELNFLRPSGNVA